MEDLPPLHQVLWRQPCQHTRTPAGDLAYVIPAYRDFVTFVAKACPAHAPAVYGVLDVQDEHAFATLRGTNFQWYLYEMRN